MMVSKIEINRAHLDLNLPRTVNSPASRLNTEQKVKSFKDDVLEFAETRKDRLDVNKMEAINLKRNSVAKSVRFTDMTMEKIDRHIAQMKARLLRIVKNFPPFPPGSEERVKILRSFNLFRKQIDQLTIPPVDRDAMKIIADPALVSEAGDWDFTIGDSELTRTIRSQQVHTGSRGLDIPELDEGADDEKINVDFFQVMLTKLGFSVDVAYDGEEVLEKVKNFAPDLILLDVRMPQMSGYEVCSRVKTDPRTENIPIVFLSAKGQEAEIKTGYDSGAIDYILKPFAPDYLLNRLEEILTSESLTSDY